MKTLYLESVSGVAGDMFAASFLDAGLVSEKELKAVPSLLGLNDVEVKITKVWKAGMQCTHIDVVLKGESWKTQFDSGTSHQHGAQFVPHGHGHQYTGFHSSVTPEGKALHWHTHFLDLDKLLENSKLHEKAKAFSRKVFRLLAEAEAKAHGTTVDDVAFHEVGAVDSVVDVAMAATCIAAVNADAVVASPIKLGRGLVTMEHGTHPVPPPASAFLAQGMPLASTPKAIVRENVELSTPTGVAILRALEPTFNEAWPAAGTPKQTGMGAGTMDLGTYPNVFRVTLFEGSGVRADALSALPYEKDSVLEICCNFDDQTAEKTAWLLDQVLELGALDAWVIPVTGKKGRLAHVFSVLAEEGMAAKIADFILRQSTTFGLRYKPWERLKLQRHFETRETPEGPLQYKLGSTVTGEFLKEKPEFEDWKRLQK